MAAAKAKKRKKKSGLKKGQRIASTKKPGMRKSSRHGLVIHRLIPSIGLTVGASFALQKLKEDERFDRRVINRVLIEEVARKYEGKALKKLLDEYAEGEKLSEEARKQLYEAFDPKRDADGEDDFALAVEMVGADGTFRFGDDEPEDMGFDVTSLELESD